MKKLTKYLTSLFTLVLVIIGAICLTACGDKKDPTKPEEPISTVQTINGVDYDLINDGTAYKVVDCVRWKETVDILSTVNNLPVSAIGESAFEDCDDLISVTIPTTITTIGNKSFYDCDSLQSISTGNGVITIGEKAFSRCELLKTVVLGNSVKTIGNYAFYGNIENLVWGNAVETIGDYAFSGCDLESINIPNSVTNIGSHAFWSSSKLKSVVIGNGVTSIGEAVFADCMLLNNVIIGDNVQSIGYCAFRSCAVDEIIIPSSVTTIDDYAFVYSGIKKIVIDSESVSNNLIEDESQGCLLWDYYESELFAETVYVKTGLRVTNSTLLLENFTKQATSDKPGYDMYVRNVE